jgi:hypothetical protein
MRQPSPDTLLSQKIILSPLCMNLRFAFAVTESGIIDFLDSLLHPSLAVPFW